MLLGPPGVGKTHLAIALGIEAIVSGSSVYFVTIQDLVAQFQRARDENKLKERMSLLVKPKLLILDEMGYLTLDSFAATCLFQLVSERYEKGSIILTSNKSYGDWGAIFADNVIASAILDRLLHHSTTINIKGESYRLKDKKKAGVVAAKLPGKEGRIAHLPPRERMRLRASPFAAPSRITPTHPNLGIFQTMQNGDVSVDDDNRSGYAGSPAGLDGNASRSGRSRASRGACRAGTGGHWRHRRVCLCRPGLHRSERR